MLLYRTITEALATVTGNTPTCCAPVATGIVIAERHAVRNGLLVNYIVKN